MRYVKNKRRYENQFILLKETSEQLESNNLEQYFDGGDISHEDMSEFNKQLIKMRMNSSYGNVNEMYGSFNSQFKYFTKNETSLQTEYIKEQYKLRKLYKQGQR